MKNRRERKMEQINNVGKPAQPVGKQESEGAPIYSSNGMKWALPNITTSLIEQYADNALLAEPVNNLKNLIFRGQAQVTITDPAGETDNDLSEIALKIYEKCELYAAHQIAFTDGIFGGCSVFSPGWDNNEPVEFRNLPWNSFRDLPQGFTDVYNDIMPGIVVDQVTGYTRVFQKKDDRSQPVEIQNFCIIKDPTSPKPAGKPDCLPVASLITNYNYADKVVNQKLNREGAPSIFPYIEKITAANKAYVEALAKRWGKDTCFILTEGMDFKDPKMILSNIAPERQAELKKRIDGYFNPATFIQKDGNSIGGSDSGAMELIYNYIDKVLSTLEAQITRVTLQKWLDENGYEGYRAEIKHPRPSVKKDAQVLAEVAELAKNGAITINEMRQSLPNTDLGELTPEEETALQEQVKGRQAQANPFGSYSGSSSSSPRDIIGQPIGNVQNPIERTEALSQVERDLITAHRQMQKDVMRIVKEQVNGSTP